MHFNPKESGTDKQRLFSMCERVLQDYIDKQEQIKAFVQEREQNGKSSSNLSEMNQNEEPSLERL